MWKFPKLARSSKAKSELSENKCSLLIIKNEEFPKVSALDSSITKQIDFRLIT